MFAYTRLGFNQTTASALSTISPTFESFFADLGEETDDKSVNYSPYGNAKGMYSIRDILRHFIDYSNSDQDIDLKLVSNINDNTMKIRKTICLANMIETKTIVGWLASMMSGVKYSLDVDETKPPTVRLLVACSGLDLVHCGHFDTVKGKCQMNKIHREYFSDMKRSDFDATVDIFIGRRQGMMKSHVLRISNGFADLIVIC